MERLFVRHGETRQTLDRCLTTAMYVVCLTTAMYVVCLTTARERLDLVFERLDLVFACLTTARERRDLVFALLSLSFCMHTYILLVVRH